jgi:hypothetical protein
MKKESVKENFAPPGKEQPKDAAQAYKLAEHYWQMSNRDALFGREDKQKVNEGLAKQFYDQYKKMVDDGDESAVDTFKNEDVIAKLESFKETEMSQTNESWYEPAGQARGDHVRKPAPKVAKITKHSSNPMRTSIGTKQKIKPEYYTQTQSCV